MGRNNFEKDWEPHGRKGHCDERAPIHLDRHMIHEGTTRPAFDGLRKMGARVRRPDLTYAVIDHGVSTAPGRTIDTYPPTRDRSHAMQRNCAEFGIDLIDVSDKRQGIVHV